MSVYFIKELRSIEKLWKSKKIDSKEKLVLQVALSFEVSGLDYSKLKKEFSK